MDRIKTPHDLYLIDLGGKRDAAWGNGFGFGRTVVRLLGHRCLACGRRIFTTGQKRVYCDEVCSRRHVRRRERFRRSLRDAGANCPYCNHEP